MGGLRLAYEALASPRSLYGDAMTSGVTAPVSDADSTAAYQGIIEIAFSIQP
jgi:hypothetical protein